MLDAGAHPGSGDEYNVDSDSDSDHGNAEVRSNESNDGVRILLSYEDCTNKY
jgi:hypothetical protein